MAETVEGLVKAEQWLMKSRLPGHEASAINAASAIQVAREAIAALEVRALAAEAQRDKAIEALKFYAEFSNYRGDLVPGHDDEHGTFTLTHHVNAVRDDAGKLARSTLDEIAP